jgi:type IV pilus assembly protein PilV
MNTPARPVQRGFLLLEVVAALLLFSLGLLGMIQLQARASQLSIDAEDRSRAALLANEMVASMWAQRKLKVDDATLLAWQAKVADPAAGGLQDGRGVVNNNDPALAIITVMWTPVAGQTVRLDHQYSTSVVMPNPAVTP